MRFTIAMLATAIGSMAGPNQRRFTAASRLAVLARITTAVKVGATGWRPGTKPSKSGAASMNAKVAQ